MPDYGKLREAGKSQKPTLPSDIFARLVKPPHIRDLSRAQAEVLDKWYERRNSRDVVMKLNTGAGKTLVGLIAAQSTMNEIRGRVLYLCPNTQLVEQTIAKAAEVKLRTEQYKPGEGALPPRFVSGDAILVATYAALFNGKSLFGVENDAEYTRVGLLVLDDAHVELSDLRKQFTLRFSADSLKEGGAYEELIDLLRPYFLQTGKPGLFEDIVDGKEWAVMELPYWLWFEVKDRVFGIVREQDRIEWPLLRDNLQHCHCIVGHKSISITPILPMVNMFPTFDRATRRLFMSATLADDSVLAATFGLGEDVLKNAITSTSLTGVSERMILLAGAHEHLHKDAMRKVVEELVVDVPKRGKGAVILVPSKDASKEWSGIAPLMDSPTTVARRVVRMQSGEDRGPVVFANRYDGMDLPGDTCRLLVIDGLPQGRGEYETARGTALIESSEIAANLAQRLEQGTGRGARGSSDYCAVALLGDDLISWLGDKSHWDFMTSSTRAQISIGENLTASLTNIADFKKALLDCVDHDDAWVQYYNDEIADRVDKEKAPRPSDSPMMIERTAFEAARSGDVPKAIDTLLEACATTSPLSKEYKGWFLQMAARYTWAKGDHTTALDMQQKAYKLNRRVFQPNAEIEYEPTDPPSADQAEQVLTSFNDFRRGKDYIGTVELNLRNLRGEATSNEFEEAMGFLGKVLGFAAERPDKTLKKGPDVLWLTHQRHAYVIEVKSKKLPESALTKDEKGQLLNACEWFKENYGGWAFTPVVAMPNPLVTEASKHGPAFCLSFESLNRLRNAVIDALHNIHQLQRTSPSRVRDAAEILKSRNLTAGTITAYFQGFETVEDHAGQKMSLFGSTGLNSRG